MRKKANWFPGQFYELIIIDLSMFFLTFDMDKFEKIRQPLREKRL